MCRDEIGHCLCTVKHYIVGCAQIGFGLLCLYVNELIGDWSDCWLIYCLV